MSTDATYYLDVIFIGYHLRVGALALLLYEYFLTLDDEVELFWKRRRTLATYLFLWTRYGGMILLASMLSLVTAVPDRVAACKGWFTVEMCLGCINTWVIQAILFLRLYALYNFSRVIAIAAAILFAMQTMTLAALGIYVLPILWSSLKIIILSGMTYCEVVNDHVLGLDWGVWFSFAVFEAFILFFTIRKGRILYRRQRELSVRLTSLVSTLYWDSIYYTILIELFYISSMTLSLINHKNYDLLAGLGFVMPVIMGGRMMINVRRLVRDDRYRQSPSTPSDILSLHVVGVDDPDQSPPPDWTFTYI